MTHVKLKTMDSNNQDEVAQSFQRLVGEECWSVVAGVGSMFVLDFGRRIPCERPTNNPLLSPEQQNNDGEFWLHVLGCAWRIDAPDRVICGWRDDNSNYGSLVTGLKMLVGHRVLRCNVSYPAYDLEMLWSNGLTLRIFCDQEDGDDNYTLSVPGDFFSIKSKGTIDRTP